MKTRWLTRLGFLVAASWLVGCFPPIPETDEDGGADTTQDSAALDSTHEETAEPDAFEHDATTVDSEVTGDVDTVSPDTATADTAVADTATATVDTVAADTTTVDTSVVDTMTADTSLADTTTDTVTIEDTSTTVCPSGCADLDGLCVRGFCDAGTCRTEALDDGVTCDDGKVCTVGDHCAAGVCVGSDLVCDDGIACSHESCEEAAGGCSFDKSECGCTGDDASCGDRNDCNGVETCGADLLCHPGTPVTCGSSTDPCLANLCDPETGQCATIPANENAPCSDGLACTTHDRCHGGVCGAGDAVDCDDGIDCTVTACGEAEGGCYEVSDTCSCDVDADCSNGNACDGEEVCGPKRSCEPGTPVSCEPTGDPCTVSSCVPATGACVVSDAPTSTGCDDGDACTIGDHCGAGTCHSGNPSSDAFGDWSVLLGRNGETGFDSNNPYVPLATNKDAPVTIAVTHLEPYPVYLPSWSVPSMTLPVDLDGVNTTDLVTYSASGTSVDARRVGWMVNSPLASDKIIPLAAPSAIGILAKAGTALPDGESWVPSGSVAVVAIADSGGVLWSRVLTASSSSGGTSFVTREDLASSGGGPAERIAVMLTYFGDSLSVTGLGGQPTTLAFAQKRGLVVFSQSGELLWTRSADLHLEDRVVIGPDGHLGVAGELSTDLELETSSGQVVIPKVGVSAEHAFIAFSPTGEALWARAMTTAGIPSSGQVRITATGRWVFAFQVLAGEDAAVIGPNGIELIVPAAPEETASASVLAMVDDGGVLHWTHRLPGLGPDSTLRLTRDGGHLVWLATASGTSMELDDVALSVATGTTAVFAIQASVNDGHVTGIRRVASYDDGDNYLTKLGMAASIDGSIYVAGWMGGTAVLGAGNPEPVAAGSGIDAVFLMRVNSGGALFCQ